jgi:hypothetical protein
VAVNGRHIYWANQNGTIGDANLDGSNPQTIVTSQGLPTGVAVSGFHVYWTDQFADTIDAASLAGGHQKILASGQSRPIGVAVGP